MLPVMQVLELEVYSELFGVSNGSVQINATKWCCGLS
jgi:hypothetical protein